MTRLRAGSKKTGAHPKAAPKESIHMQSTELQLTVQPMQHAATFVREGFVTLNPAQMNVILRECQYDRQRAISADHVSVLAEMMRRGLWERKDKIDFASLDGRLILVNGYHRANAQIDAGQNIEWTIVIHSCATDAEVRSLYYRFDTNVRKRSDENILNGVDFASENKIRATTAKALFGAAPMIANGLLSGTVKSAENIFAKRIMDDRLETARVYAPAALVLENLIALAPEPVRKKLRIKTIFAVALVTVHHQPEVAANFWGGLTKNDGLRRGDARATLLQDIMSRNFHAGLVSQGFAVPAIAWNAFWDRRDLKVINKVSAGRTIRLHGTPYTVSC